MAASAPPVTITSCRPLRIISNASPIACAPEAQAVVVVMLTPRAPRRMAICPGARFPITAG